jgi:UTP--glucose-1-phosphate uridylyltransferase
MTDAYQPQESAGVSAPSPRIRLIETIQSPDPAVRDRSVRTLVEGASSSEILEICQELEAFRRGSDNLYERVRATIFLHYLYRYALQDAPDLPATGLIPFAGFKDLMERRFEQSVSLLLDELATQGPNSTLFSGLAQAYEQMTFQTLADQVRRSVRGSRGNRWMFRVGAIDEHPLRVDSRLFERTSSEGQFPILVERTPVRLDLSHSAWSDIFFLGMDYPEGARVLNISVDLGLYGRDDQPRPPIETYCRVIAEPVLRLTSIDLGDSKDVRTLDELFNFGNDYLGLVKAGVIASGFIPPALEGTGQSLATLLGRLVRPGFGFEVVSKVNDIPKGSRLAVSTNLLASLITLLMRATGQTRCLTGPLESEEARVVVARAILGEWLGGSGGGWQDSGGIFPGIKRIRGMPATEQDPEWGISRGRLLPEHEILDVKPSAGADGPSSNIHETLAQSLILVHGGMAQNVGPILNMVTAKYLLRGESEWRARQEALQIFDEIGEAVASGDVQQLGRRTTRNWDGPLKQIIPWVTNRFTEEIIRRAREALGEDFWGFLMLGGMSGGGMGFFVAPHRRSAFRDQLLAIMRDVKGSLDDALPFAMEPVVYDFKINPRGTWAEMKSGAEAMMPARYYTLQVASMIQAGVETVEGHRKADLDHFVNHTASSGELVGFLRSTVNRLFPVARTSSDPAAAQWAAEAEAIRRDNGFDPVQHAALREDLQRGRIGLARNRLPVDTDIRDVADEDLIRAEGEIAADVRAAGEEAIARGEAAIVTLSAGIGSRWTSGAGVVKAVNPFVFMAGEHRSFLELHLAKTRRSEKRYGARIPHVVTTSYLTHSAIERHLGRAQRRRDEGPVLLSRGQSIGQRLIPMTRDLEFLWSEAAHETLDENKQKVREASRRAILEWARSKGEGTDYTDNVPLQRFNPPGHFYEVPTMLRNGVLAELLETAPNLKWLLVHNIDSLGANLDPGVLGLVARGGSAISFEVVPRRFEDRGGGLARVGGRLRLLEGLAQPREETEFRLRYYNTLTSWVDIEGLLRAFELTRDDVRSNPSKVAAAVRGMAARLPTYVTIKDVKRRWGHGQEDILPVTQFEKLWGDLTSLPDLSCSFLAVDRRRGQQLKDAAQLDSWANDGTADYVAALCEF